LPDSLRIDEFLNYPEEGRTYEVPDNNTLIEELIEIYKQPCIDDGDIDELLFISAASNKTLKHVRMLEHYIGISLKFVSVMKPNTIDEFFQQQ